MIKNKKLIIYGDSSYARMLAHYFTIDSEYEVVAYCVDRAYKTQEQIDACPVVDFETLEERFPRAQGYEIFAAIGYKSVRMHKKLYEKIASKGYNVASYISSRAMVDSTATIGENCMILPGVIIEPYVCVASNVFINSGAIVSHHAQIDAHSIIAGGALIGGYTQVGEASLIGFRATVAELLRLGEETLVGAGSVVLSDTQPHTFYAGVPARAKRTHKENGIEMIAKQPSRARS
jgi:sugar O-acyltransferase (sialic acid O-acetyltransferase NeuD family)